MTRASQVLILVVAVATSIHAGSYKVTKPTEWWQTTTLYQIWPMSFKDSDGDGIGDLKGIISKLEYLVDLGIETISLAPLCRSPMIDSGYDVSDFHDVQPEFGTLDDFKNFVAKAHELGMRVVVDFVPNHTSDEHEWFVRAKAGEKPYVDYYIWNEGKIVNGTRQPPNNWVNVLSSGSAWEWLEERQAYYLHQFGKQQPDLNLRNVAVIERTKDIMTYWMDLGVDGWRIDGVSYFNEDKQLRDEPVERETRIHADSVYPTDRRYTKNLPENYGIVREWRKHIDRYNAKVTDGRKRMMFTEADADVSTVMEYYNAGSNVPLNNLFIKDDQGGASLPLDKGHNIVHGINLWMAKMPAGGTPNWVFGTHGNSRVATTFGVERVDAVNALLYTLPGVAVTYYGEEIGMVDKYVSWEDTKDVHACEMDESLLNYTSRDPERTPLQWDDTTSAGFSTNLTTFLPVNENYLTLNVAAQKEAEVSHYKNVQALIKLRSTKVLKEGSLDVRVIGEDVIVYTRESHGEQSIVVIINWSKDDEATVSLKKFETIPEKIEVLVADINSGISVGDVLSKSRVTLPAAAALVCRGIDASEE